MKMEEDEWQDMEMRTINTIHLFLVNNVLFNIMDEDSAWDLREKLENYAWKIVLPKNYI